MKLIKYIETVEVKTNSTTKTKFYFDEQPVLRKKRILHVQAWRVGYVSESPSDLAVVNDVVFQKSFLVLVSKGKEIINRIPLVQLTNYFQNENALLLDLMVNFPKSYIEIGSIASLSASETFLFTFYCNDRIEEIPEYRGINIENIEVKTTPATIRQFYFPDHENLRGKKIHSIEFNNNSLTMAPGGESLVNSTVRLKTFLTIESKGRQAIKRIPLQAIRNQTPSSSPAGNLHAFRIPLDEIEIDFPNSYFEVPDTADTVADEVFFLNVYYYDRVIKKN